MKQIIFIIIASLCLFSFSTVQKETLPKGWLARGKTPDNYVMGLENTVFKSGKGAAFIKVKNKKLKGFGTLMSTFPAKKYLGKTVILTGYIKTKDVHQAAMWLRIDGSGKHKVVAFDNMGKDYITGTHDWTKYSITMHIPKNGEKMNFGVYLDGKGEVWFDDMKIEVTPSTTSNNQKPLFFGFEQ